MGRFVTHGRESARAVGVHKAWLMGTIETFRGPDQASCAPLALMTNFASAESLQLLAQVLTQVNVAAA